MTDNLYLLRENKRVESVDPALPAAFAWQAEAPDDRNCSAALTGFLAGAAWQKGTLAREIAPEIVGIMNAFITVLRTFAVPGVEEHIAMVEAERNDLLELCSGVTRDG